MYNFLVWTYNEHICLKLCQEWNIVNTVSGIFEISTTFYKIWQKCQKNAKPRSMAAITTEATFGDLFEFRRQAWPKYDVWTLNFKTLSAGNAHTLNTIKFTTNMSLLLHPNQFPHRDHGRHLFVRIKYLSSFPATLHTEKHPLQGAKWFPLKRMRSGSNISPFSWGQGQSPCCKMTCGYTAQICMSQCASLQFTALHWNIESTVKFNLYIEKWGQKCLWPHWKKWGSTDP